MSGFTIRDAQWPLDRQAALGFIMGLQRFEHAIEPDRRLDDAVAEEFFVELMARVKTRQGRVFMADGEAGEALGWAVAYVETNDIYVIAEERRFGYISELYVVEAARSTGVGRALIAVCENWALAQGLKVMVIGVLAANTRAFGIYRRTGYTPYATQLRKYL